LIERFGIEWESGGSVGNYVVDSGNIVSLPNAHFVKVTDTSFGDLVEYSC
jgi:hypothetical protein